MDTKPKTTRTSLTPKQAASESGQALIKICMTLIDDGELTDDEIKTLEDWLNHSLETFSAIEHLRTAITQYQESQNKLTVYEAIEKILPTAERKVAKDNRKTVERLHKQRNKPINRFNFMVAGCRHEGRDRLIDKFVELDDIVILERELDNPHDKYAVQVQTKQGHHIGYAPRDYSRELAKLMTPENKYVAYFSKLLNDYSASTIPVVDATFYKMDADEDQDEIYIIPSQGIQHKGSGCGTAAILIASVLTSGIWLTLKDLS